MQLDDIGKMSIIDSKFAINKKKTQAASFFT